ncbi:ABC transporter ATP-binding protein [Peribacillus cavernae]|uniref:ABC transporter ATP-binding protein n=1 Tax=Peribacillus cavernae TaxID=1674310 RepID=A0A3S0VS26_9BACI|nr:ABC transporter ATP-binding protein [Peribacillus cavernae]MDQ0218573.1 oligopeptide/dipeptide ABC transporter ATP-binding protein [Peribacillus cavernae]RUQ31562.1 ABC transporter ATP-binding protein [Peribacillus cavernae]
MEDTILKIDNLHVSFKTHNDGETKAVRGVSFELKKGETLAIVGESGSGKSVTAKSLMRLLPKQNSMIKDGQVFYEGKDLLKYSIKEMQKIRGSEISMVFQDPMTSLNPTMTIGKQIMEGLRKHQAFRKKELFKKAADLLELVGIPSPMERMKDYPHQFSGGMRQRVVIAMALACNPKVLLADEPTTALDVTIQAQILDLMKDLQKKTGTAIIIITHDLGVVASMAQRVAVMYAGEIIETGTVDEIFYEPKHPYTCGLLLSMPKLHAARSTKLIPIPGIPPDLGQLPEGCPFAARCPYVMKVCHSFSPSKTEVSETHSVSCWLEDERAPQVEWIDGAGGSIDERKRKVD